MSEFLRYQLPATMTNKNIFLRLDLDVDLVADRGRLVVAEAFRLRCALPTLRFLLNCEPKTLVLAGHLDRPGGRFVANLSLAPVASWFGANWPGGKRRVKKTFWRSFPAFRLEGKPDVFLLENLRFWPGEEANDPAFAQRLAKRCHFFVNEAFAVSHRCHASTVGIAKLLPSFLGLHFQEELEKIDWVVKSAPRPLVFVLGGSKPDKLDWLEFLASFADLILVGGKLPLLAGKEGVVEGKIVWAKLTTSKKDISSQSIVVFQKHIAKASSIIWAGPMGVYEDENFLQGSQEIALAIAESKAKFKMAGGGDTHRLLTILNLWPKMDWVSTGGGALIYHLKQAWQKNG